MTESESSYCLKAMSESNPEICEECPLHGQTGTDHCSEDAIRVAINALEVNKKITEIVNRQLIAGKNNYKEIYNSFHEIAKVIQDNYQWSEV